MKTEYLIRIDTKDNVATTEETFVSKLKSNVKLNIRKNKIKYESIEVDFRLKTYQTDNPDYIYFLMTMELPDEKADELAQIREYTALIKVIKGMLRVKESASNIEILWDDVTLYLSSKIYPKIYRVENLMRKLLTQFMCINVGRMWEKDSIPETISNSKSGKRERNDDNSLLYRLDFIELSNMLFDDYTVKNFKRLKKDNPDKTEFSLSELEEYLPKSNWSRYFKDVVDAEGDQLKKKWTELYEYRCKIAHNNHFTIDDFDETNKLIDYFMPKIENAISMLDRVKVDEEEKAVIEDTYDAGTSEAVGRYLAKWRLFYNLFREYAQKHNCWNERIFFTLEKLRENGLLDNNQCNDINNLRRFRNMIAHSTLYEYEIVNVEMMIVILERYIKYFKKENEKSAETNEK